MLLFDSSNVIVLRVRHLRFMVNHLTIGRTESEENTPTPFAAAS